MLAIMNQGQVEPALRRIATATQTLLRHTLGLDEADWRAPSRLPGWSRAHVATHVARNADALRRVIAATRVGDPQPLYPSEAEKFNDIERGAERSGLNLHVDLDTSAAELARLCERVEDWMAPIRVLGGEMPLSVVPLIRLQEVTLHLLDLDAGYHWAEIEPVPAGWLLEWMLLLLRDERRVPAVSIVSDQGVTADLGPEGERVTATGTDAALWAWVTGRSDGEGVTGAEGITWPLAG